MRVHRLFITVHILVLADQGLSSPTWIINYDGVGTNTIKCVLPLSNGHTVFSATCYSPPDISGSWTAEIDENGDILWNYYNDHPPLGIAEINGEGCILLTGTASSCRVIRLDQSGNEIWEHPAAWTLAGIVGTADGHFVYRSVGNLIKIDKDFNTIWTLEPPEPGVIQILGPSYSPSGGFAAAGVNPGSFSDTVAAGTADSLGVFGSVGYITGGGGIITALSAYSDVDESCYGVVQYLNPMPPNLSDEIVFRFNAGGELNWSREIDDMVALCRSTDGHPVVVGEESPDYPVTFFVRKLDPGNGDTIWSVVHGNGDDSFVPYCIATASDGGFIVGGGCSEGTAVLAKTDSEGLINGMGIEEDLVHGPLHVSPVSNPSGSSVLLRIQAPESSGLSLVIHDSCGRVVFSQSMGTGMGIVNAGTLPTGMYTASILSDEHGIASCRLVVLN